MTNNDSRTIRKRSTIGCGDVVSEALRDLDSYGGPMKRTWTIIGVGDVPGSFKWYQALFGVSRRPFLPMTTLCKSSIQMELSCSASTSGAPTSIPL